MPTSTYIGNFIKDQRKRMNLTQEELAAKAGVGLRFIREMEQGKESLRMDKVNQVLALLGYELLPGKEPDPYNILENYINKNVKIFLKNKSVLYGFIIREVRDANRISGWQFVENNKAIEFQSNGNASLIQTIKNIDIERIENA